jgi:hypothetical protein
MKNLLTAMPLTHDALLMWMPFELGYTCDEENKPDEDSVKLALTLHTMNILLQPHVIKDPLPN